MKVSDVSKDDCIKAAQLINMLQLGKYDVGGKDMCAGADSIRWLQSLAVEMAGAHAGTTKPAAPPPEGLAVKTYNPGKPGKK